MEKEIIKNYWEKQILFKRYGNKLVYVNKPQSSIANMCEIGDKVNGYIVNKIILGMGYCYCVFTEENHCFYSWNIETIETKAGKYKIIEKDNKILIVEENEKKIS